MHEASPYIHTLYKSHPARRLYASTPHWESLRRVTLKIVLPSFDLTAAPPQFTHVYIEVVTQSKDDWNGAKANWNRGS
eukprot:6195573-Pleurochrysis_carterae.AAC.2